MSRLSITAKPSVDDTVAMLHRRELRHSYRVLRRHLPRWYARLIISYVIDAGTQEVRP
jgi:hypothetical protein